MKEPKTKQHSRDWRLGHKVRQIIDTVRVPEYHLFDDELESADIDYSIRAATDYVVSGPIKGDGAGLGRVFSSVDEAEAWGKDFFGERFRWMITDSERGGRWAMLIKEKQA